MNNEIVLSAQQISMSYGQSKVLDNVSIDIRAGEVTTLLGPNGAGKSSLLKLLCGEIPSRCDISYFGRSKKQWQPSDLAKHLGMLPQHSTLSFPFLVHEVVELGGIPLNLPNKQVKLLAQKYMEMTDVGHLSERLYPSLSGGEKQRVHLARVLVQLAHSDREKILMLDEPTSALDLAHQHNTLKIARRLADEHCAVVVVLHDLNLAAQYSDRLVVLHQGNIACDEAPWHALDADLIKQVYGYDALITSHPTLNFPLIFPAS